MANPQLEQGLIEQESSGFILVFTLKIKSLEKVIHFCHGNQLMGSTWLITLSGGKFSRLFSDSSQMMLKLGRNIRWVEIF